MQYRCSIDAVSIDSVNHQNTILPMLLAWNYMVLYTLHNIDLSILNNNTVPVRQVIPWYAPYYNTKKKQLTDCFLKEYCISWCLSLPPPWCSKRGGDDIFIAPCVGVVGEGEIGVVVGDSNILASANGEYLSAADGERCWLSNLVLLSNGVASPKAMYRLSVSLEVMTGRTELPVEVGLS